MGVLRLYRATPVAAVPAQTLALNGEWDVGIKERSRGRWIVAVVTAGLLGGAIALFTAMMLLIQGATSELEQYASEFLSQDERIAQNIDLTLSEGNRSTAAACSDQDLALLRKLLFRSPYLKDVGRVEHSALLCSAVAGRLAVPFTGRVEVSTNYNGRKIYYNVDLHVAEGETAEIVEEGRTNVVVSPEVFADFSRPPMQFTGAIVDRTQSKVLPMYSSSSANMPLEFLLGDKLMRKDGTLYYPKCSATRPDCVLTALPMSRIWQPGIPTMTGSFVAGAGVGSVFVVAMWAARRRQRSMGGQLRRAVQQKQLSVAYQPIVDVNTGSITSAEALVRWTDEDRNSVRPDVFIPVAEEQGFIGEITTFVLCRVMEEMGDAMRAGFRVTVNLSARDLADSTFLDRLDTMVREANVPASSVGLELTERSTAEKDVVVRAIRALRERGHVVYVDDFGTGYSSLSYLHELSVDVLKMDRAFTNTIGTDSVTASIVPQIFAMASTLRLRVVVEGVEQESQAEELKLMAPDAQAQGWLYGRPMPAADLRKLLL